MSETKNAPGAMPSMILGIISISLVVLSCGYSSIVSLVLGIVALVLAAKAKKAMAAEPGVYAGAGVRTTGFVCGLIGLILGALSTIFVVFIVVALLAGGNALAEAMKAEMERQNRMSATSSTTR